MGRDSFAAGRLPQIGLPAEAVALPRPDILAGMRDGFAHTGAVVQHRIGQHLMGNRNRAAVARHDAQRRGKPAARAFAAHDDAVAVDAKRIGLRIKPCQHGITIVNRGRIRRFRRQPVIDRNHRALIRLHRAYRRRIPRFRRAGDEAAAMNVQQHRHLCRRPLGLVAENAHRAPIVAWNGLLRNAHTVRRGLFTLQLPAFGQHRAHGTQCLSGKIAEGQGLQPRDKLRIDERGNGRHQVPPVRGRAGRRSVRSGFCGIARCFAGNFNPPCRPCCLER